MGFRVQRITLTEAQELRMCQRYLAGESQTTIGADFDVTQARVSAVCRKHLTVEQRKVRYDFVPGKKKKKPKRNRIEQCICGRPTKLRVVTNRGLSSELCWKCSIEFRADFMGADAEYRRDLVKWKKENAEGNLLAANEVALLNGMFEYRTLPIVRVTELPQQEHREFAFHERRYPLDVYVRNIEQMICSSGHRSVYPYLRINGRVLGISRKRTGPRRNR